MRTIRLRTIALACSCLFTAPLSAFAHTSGQASVASAEGDATVTAGDAAAPSLQCALASAKMAALPSSESGAGVA